MKHRGQPWSRFGIFGHLSASFFYFRLFENIYPIDMLLEIAVYSSEAAIAAQRAGADRIELCSAPAEGGLTPSRGIMRLVRNELKIPVHTMVRPREGDFCYSALEFSAMLLDVEDAREAGMDGVVCGILTSEGAVDEERMRMLVEKAKPMEVTFHRAFDMSRNPEDSLEKLIKCGIKRVLTSGGRQTAIEGLPAIKQLVTLASGRISVMPGSGINEKNISEITSVQGIREVHLSAKRFQPGVMNYRNETIAMGGNARIPEYDLLMPDSEVIKNILHQIKIK